MQTHTFPRISFIVIMACDTSYPIEKCAENDLHSLHTQHILSTFTPKYCVGEDDEGTRSSLTAAGGKNDTKEARRLFLLRHLHLPTLTNLGKQGAKIPPLYSQISAPSYGMTKRREISHNPRTCRHANRHEVGLTSCWKDADSSISRPYSLSLTCQK